jgi:hypothetical protein
MPQKGNLLELLRQFRRQQNPFQRTRQCVNCRFFQHYDVVVEQLIGVIGAITDNRHATGHDLERQQRQIR